MKRALIVPGMLAWTVPIGRSWPEPVRVLGQPALGKHWRCVKVSALPNGGPPEPLLPVVADADVVLVPTSRLYRTQAAAAIYCRRIARW